MTDNTTKDWWTSKTVWLNVVLTLIGIATLFATANAMFPTWVPAAAALVIGVLNVVLRVWFTATPVTQFAARHAQQVSPK